MNKQNLPTVVGGLYELGTPKEQEAFDEMSQGGDWLPRLIVLNGQTKHIQNPEIGFRQGNLAIIYDDTRGDELGKEVEVVPLGWRFHAIRTKPTVESFYDPRSDGFKAIQEESTKPNSGCFYGPEFLCVVLPTMQFVTFPFFSNSARRVAPVMRQLFNERKVALVKPKYVTSKKTGQSWFIPEIIEANTTLEEAGLTPEIVHKAREILQKFQNPSSGESVDSDDDEQDR